MHEVTRILSAIEQGDPKASEQLLPLVYKELRRLAAAMMAKEKPGQTLQATALVHDAYIRLVDVDQAQHWDSRGHFFAAAAEAMRSNPRGSSPQESAEERGGDLQRVDIDAIDIAVSAFPEQLLAIDEALAALATLDPSAAAIVKLRYFAGLSVEQSASAIGVSTKTAYRHWSYARAWLHSELLRSGD